MFKEGDVVIGRNSSDGPIGNGSICRVLRVFEDQGMMVVEVLKPAPQWCEAGRRFDASLSGFVLKPETPMKIEAIKVYRCQQDRGTGPCEDIAQHRVTIPGLSVTFCEAHAQPYIKGTDILEAVVCTYCGGTCKPGYVRHDYARPFCNEVCEEGYRHRQSARQYASAPY